MVSDTNGEVLEDKGCSVAYNYWGECFGVTFKEKERTRTPYCEI